MGEPDRDDGVPVRRILKMIHRNDGLMKLLHDLAQAGYSPGVNFEAVESQL